MPPPPPPRGRGGRPAPSAAPPRPAVPEPSRYRYYALWKPYGVQTRFDDPEGRPTLRKLVPVPGVYPVGRLDADSEGLLLLTDDPRFQAAVTRPGSRHGKTYLVQVEREPSPEALEELRQGVLLEGRATLAAEVEVIPPPVLPERPVPIRYRKNVPTCWLELVLFEGRNRQVRRMTAAVGHPTLRLVRWAVGPITLEGMTPGQLRELRRDELAWAQQAAADAPVSKRKTAHETGHVPGRERQGRPVRRDQVPEGGPRRDRTDDRGGTHEPHPGKAPGRGGPASGRPESGRPGDRGRRGPAEGRGGPGPDRPPGRAGRGAPSSDRPEGRGGRGGPRPEGRGGPGSERPEGRGGRGGPRPEDRGGRGGARPDHKGDRGGSGSGRTTDRGRQGEPPGKPGKPGKPGRGGSGPRKGQGGSGPRKGGSGPPRKGSGRKKGR